MSFTDTGQAPGSTVKVRRARHRQRRQRVNSNWATVTVSGANTLDPYAATVLGDGASKYWRLDESTAPTKD